MEAKDAQKEEEDIKVGCLLKLIRSNTKRKFDMGLISPSSLPSRVVFPLRPSFSSSLRPPCAADAADAASTRSPSGISGTLLRTSSVAAFTSSLTP